MFAYAIAGLLFFVGGVAIYTGIEYRRKVQVETERVDQRLAVGAQALYSILGSEYFERARQPDSVSTEEDWDNIRKLSDFNETAGLAFIYSAVLVGNDIHLTSSSATAEEVANGVEVRYFDRYDTASASLHQVFRTPERKYANYTDKWGTFRALYVPHKLTNNATAVLVAEVELHELTTLRRQLIRKHVLEAFIFLAFAMPLFGAVVYTQRNANAALLRQNRTDALTELGNRSCFLEALAQAVTVGARNQATFGLLFLDLDGFKEINDGFGHLTGDRMLVAVTRVLQSKLGPHDQLFRVGGDEFCVLVQGDRHRCEDLAERINHGFKQSICVNDYELFLTCCVGISLFPEHGKDTTELLKRADLAMYAARGLGLNQYSVYSESMSGQAERHAILRQQLEAGLIQQEFFFLYQPQVQIATGRIVGVEALLRWRRGADEYMVPPEEFIPYAETTGLIDDIFERTLGSALANAARWNRATVQPFKVSINYASQQLFRPSFDDMLIAKLAEYHCDPHWLELEITERSIVRRSDNLLQLLQRLRDRGITISVDDFGTGYSSLSYLKDLPVDKIKIDKSFVDNLPYDQGAVALTRAIVELSLGLGLSVIAEGVERPDQADFLANIGCPYVQGYVFYRPLSAAEITNLVDAGQSK
ncbi:MAG: EAL domain-containing protein [Haliea sp.]